MNNARRKELSRAAEMLREAQSIIECCKDEEEEACNNIEEKFPNKADEMQEYIDTMDEALEAIDGAADSIEEIAG